MNSTDSHDSSGSHTASGGMATTSPPPLVVHVLYHPESQPAEELALNLFGILSGPSHDWGPRIPVLFGETADDGRPSSPTIRPGTRSLVVVLVDSRMARRATVNDRQVADAWSDLIAQLLESYPPGTSNQCSVLPVAVDLGGLQLSHHLAQRSFVRLDATGSRHLEFHVVIGCLRLLRGKPASEVGEANRLPPSDVEVFVSHAKRDLPRETWRGAVAALLRAHDSLPLKPWFDSSDIPPGERFAQEIHTAIERASAVLVVLSDNYSSREWCRKEILTAKALGRPIVVADAIESQVTRLFPYIGNAPTVRWRAALAEATTPEVVEPRALLETWESEDASTVLLITLVEALRHEHELVRLAARAASSDVVLGTHPELLTLANTPSGHIRLLYPDPPIGREELNNIQQLRPDVHLSTPMEALVRRRPGDTAELVALSLSGSGDARRYGGTGMHLATMAHDVALYLLMSGFRLAYGGVLGHGAMSPNDRSPGRDVNFVEQLMELVERHSPLAQQAGRHLKPIQNWLAWPAYDELSSAQRNLYRENRAELVEVAPPPDLDIKTGQFERGPNGLYPTDTRVARYIRARCISKMRTESTSKSFARVAMGGTLESYAGPVPGIAEEALLTLRRGQPLYLLGGFGGAARAVIDCLRGEIRPEMSDEWSAEHVEGWLDLIGEYNARGRTPATPGTMAKELRDRGKAGLGAALSNGLSDEQNDELATTTVAQHAIELVLQGLETERER